LKIKNLALLDQVTLEIDAGFTAVTGETGAGKSVLLGALGLLAGARTDKTLIREGADFVEVEAALYFQAPAALDAFLESAGLAQCEDGVLLLQRSIHKTKMPRIQINGALATLAQLQLLGEMWIDFHGPGEPQKLFQEKRQLEMLDSYAGNEESLSNYQSLFSEWRAVLKEVETLEVGERMDADEIAFVEQQIQKIDQAEVNVESIEALELDFARMSSAQELAELAAVCAQGLGGEDGVADQLSTLLLRLESIAELDRSCEPLLERMRSTLIELQDIGDEVDHMVRDFNFDPDVIEATTERMNLWQEIRRKYGGTIEAVLSRRQELAEKLAVQGDMASILSKKREVADRLEIQLKKQAEQLTLARASKAKLLAKKAAALLQALGFKKARLAIEVHAATQLYDCGDSRCRFLFAANAGQSLMPLNKIASSGETARVMLALKTVLAEVDATPLLVFDEVDANVGGEVGRAVGTELVRLANEHQVLCVTHLPQVAALAQNHLVVRKTQQDDSTTVTIESIDDAPDARLEELARMLGDRNSASARVHAKELMLVQ